MVTLGRGILIKPLMATRGCAGEQSCSSALGYRSLSRNYASCTLLGGTRQSGLCCEGEWQFTCVLKSQCLNCLRIRHHLRTFTVSRRGRMLCCKSCVICRPDINALTADYGDRDVVVGCRCQICRNRLKCVFSLRHNAKLQA